MQHEVKLGLILGVVLLAIGILFWSQIGGARPTEEYVYDSGFQATAAELLEPVPPSELPSSEVPIPSHTAEILPDTQSFRTLNPDVPDATEAESSPEPGSRIHVSARGDTLWSLAEKYYGSGAKWKVIAEANRSMVPESNQLKAGMRVAIPPDTSQTASAQDDSQKEYRTHIVQPGDSLSKLSSKYYGAERHWKKLLEANKKSVSRPGALQVGTRLIIPPLS